MANPLRSPNPDYYIPIAHAARPPQDVPVRVFAEAPPALDLEALGRANPDHHLWRNRRLWWVAFTILRGPLQERIRRSLGTADLGEARRRRDEMLARYAADPSCSLSLRVSDRKVGGNR